MKPCIVLSTCANRTEARRIARALVQERLAACVNMTPIRSVYEWEGKLHDSPEILLIIKTTRARLKALSKRIQALHSYSVPEVVCLPILAGDAKYLSWVGAQCRGTSK